MTLACAATANSASRGAAGWGAQHWPRQKRRGSWKRRRTNGGARGRSFLWDSGDRGREEAKEREHDGTRWHAWEAGLARPSGGSLRQRSRSATRRAAEPLVPSVSPRIWLTTLQPGSRATAQPESPYSSTAAAAGTLAAGSHSCGRIGGGKCFWLLPVLVTRQFAQTGSAVAHFAENMSPCQETSRDVQSARTFCTLSCTLTGVIHMGSRHLLHSRYHLACTPAGSTASFRPSNTSILSPCHPQKPAMPHSRSMGKQHGNETPCKPTSLHHLCFPPTWQFLRR